MFSSIIITPLFIVNRKLLDLRRQAEQTQELISNLELKRVGYTSNNNNENYGRRVRSRLTYYKPYEVLLYMGNGQYVPKSIRMVRFHPSVVAIGEGAFHNYNSNLKEVVLNEGLETIGKRAFTSCESLQSITFPSTVKSIGLEAFRGCSSLKEVVLNEGLVEIEDNAFYGCSSLQSITVPSSVDEISYQAFEGCSKLREVTLNDGLVKIGSSVFQRCASLESITIPSSVVEIGSMAFENCRILKEVVLNEGLKKIGSNLFSGCSSLESVSLPSTLVDIGCSAFMSCTNLREVVCIEGMPKVTNNMFDSCSALERLTFPGISSRLEAIIQSGQVDIQNEVQHIIGKGEIKWKKGDKICIHVLVERSVWGLVKECVGQAVSWIRHDEREAIWGIKQRKDDSWDTTKQILDKIVSKVKYYEMKEATTLFELALWKAEMNEVEDDDIDPIDRDSFRVYVPGPVKDAITQYL